MTNTMKELLDWQEQELLRIDDLIKSGVPYRILSIGKDGTIIEAEKLIYVEI